jgi:hypothetical protein
MTRRSAGEEADERSGFGLQKVAERTGNPTEQRLIMNDGRSLGFAEYRAGARFPRLPVMPPRGEEL